MLLILVKLLLMIYESHHIEVQDACSDALGHHMESSVIGRDMSSGTFMHTNTASVTSHTSIAGAITHTNTASVTAHTNTASVTTCINTASVTAHTNTASATGHSIEGSCYGFAIVGYNIDKNVRPSYQREDRKTQSLHYFHSYAVKDRVDISSLPYSPSSNNNITRQDITVSYEFPGTD